MRVGVKRNLIGGTLNGLTGENMGEVKSVGDADFDAAVNGDDGYWLISGPLGVDRARHCLRFLSDLLQNLRLQLLR